MVPALATLFVGLLNLQTTLATVDDWRDDGDKVRLRCEVLSRNDSVAKLLLLTLLKNVPADGLVTEHESVPASARVTLRLQDNEAHSSLAQMISCCHAGPACANDEERNADASRRRRWLKAN